MKDSNKELIDLIRDELRNAGDLPYKEGAWEAYRANYEPARKVRRISLWVAAAVAALASFTFLFKGEDSSIESVKVAEVGQEIKGNAAENVDNQTEAKVDTENVPRGSAPSEDVPSFATQTSERLHDQRQLTIPHNMVMPDRVNMHSVDLAGLESRLTLTGKIRAANPMVFGEDGDPLAALNWEDDLVPGQQVDPNFAYQREAARDLSPKKMRLTDRFELGAFVSPSTTDRSFDLGGGLVFAYRFNDKVAIRTGASFNQYEVGMLGSQLQEVREEKITQSSPVANSDKLISKETTAFRNSNLFIPNLNAVTGKVQTLDIPLEVRYNLTKQFYATGGVSYAAVLSQERFDHYEESVGIPTYSSVSDSGEPVKNPVSTVSTTVASTDENVNTNGFGGFVNFSLGRRANIGKTMKVSVEPFVKFPVGQFRRADMNYTNGGIRIITSF